jgi:hypothetical protein
VKRQNSRSLSRIASQSAARVSHADIGRSYNVSPATISRLTA